MIEILNHQPLYFMRGEVSCCGTATVISGLNL